MRIGAEIPVTEPAQATNAVVQRIAQSKVQQTSSSPPAQETSPTAEVQQARAIQRLDLTFRKDSDGITYYVLTDPQSGQVVREVPAKEVRQLSANIEQYLKSQAALAAHRTDSKPAQQFSRGRITPRFSARGCRCSLRGMQIMKGASTSCSAFFMALSSLEQ